MLKHVSRRKYRKGQSLAEYGLILALISIVCIGAMTLMGKRLSGIFTDLNTQLNGVTVQTNPK